MKLDKTLCEFKGHKWVWRNKNYTKGKSFSSLRCKKCTLGGRAIPRTDWMGHKTGVFLVKLDDNRTIELKIG